MKAVLKAMVFSILFLVIFAGVSNSQKNKLIAAPNIVPPATEEMQRPEFWISRLNGNPDEVIMTTEQIKALNSKNRTKQLECKDINGKAFVIEPEVKEGNFSGIYFHMEDPLKIKTFSGLRVREDLKQLKEYLTDRELWDRRHIPFPDERKNEILDAVDSASVPSTIKPLYGMTVKHTLQRVAPSNKKVYHGQYGWLDMFQKAVLETGMPVAILHKTKDGSWLYVKSEYSLGWVPAQNVAVGSTADVRKLDKPEKFVVAINHKVPVFADRTFSIHLSDLFMGACLKLETKSSSGYKVTVPFRGPDGSLKAAEGWIKPDADVSVGFQPYTRRNVVDTFFRLLNRPYGWGGSDHERDCVGAIRAVYRTFGINMARWTEFVLFSAPNLTTFPADTPKDVKYGLLDKCEPVITVLGFRGHVVQYLGKVGSDHFIIHQNGYSYHDSEKTELKVARVSVNSTEIEGGGNIGRFTIFSEFKP